ncbi:hypothetical protein [Streptomyces sp. NPDC047972]|uniref:hypothetical protein n=1 Tax=Streptomyces sp. NPDC047972 TaxID=3365493 RepID=UPI0037240245
MPTLHEWITDRVTEAAAVTAASPATIRRCEADQRVLARHTVDPTAASSRLFATACHGCGTSGDCDDPVTENLNDCPELLDLAHAHGITDSILASLDRPQSPPPAPVDPRAAARAEARYRLLSATPARCAPATFRPANPTH